jgi:hypothetical protein
VDLLLMFDNRKVAASLAPGYGNGEFIPIWLTAQVNGKMVTGYDCLWINL